MLERILNNVLSFFFFFFYFSIPLFVSKPSPFLSIFYPIICFKILPKTKLNRKRKLYIFFSYNLKNRGKFSYSALLFSKVIGGISKTK